MEPSENPLSRYSASQIRGMMGLNMSDWPAQRRQRISSDEPLPESFDARTQWPSCIHAIRDQASCGSCWAFGAAEAFSDNLCVMSGGATNVVFSPQDLVSCDAADHGCHGGTLPSAWDYIRTKGLVSDACLPYASGGGDVPSCSPGQCTGSGEWAPVKCDHPYMMSEANDIKAGLMQYGPAETGFFVYEDFTNYKSGIYVHNKATGGGVLGGHAVKIVGWGKHFDQEYWIVANSWGPAWGESGYFRIDMHADGGADFAAGGGFGCGDGNPHPAPAPTLPPTPATCTDVVDYCEAQKAHCKDYLAQVCQKTCGCCGTDFPPAYCGNATAPLEVLIA